MKTFSLLLLTLLAAACGRQDDTCTCVAQTATGARPLSCGGSFCDGTTGYACSAAGVLSFSPEACLGRPGPACVPKSCGASCGDVADGCGGTLHCDGCATGLTCNTAHVCQDFCANVHCGAGQRCAPSTGACVADACSTVGAVCGTVQGTSCGTCPTGSTCASTQRACVQTLVTLPFDQSVQSVVVVGDTLFASGAAGSSATANDVYELSLGSGQLRTLATNSVRSPLAASPTQAFWTDSTGVRAATPGAATPTTIAGLTSWCMSMHYAEGSVFCGIGGDPRYGVSGYGIRQLPLTGGTATWLVSSLNFPRMMSAGGYLFHIGTTDNYSSFSILGATELATKSSQSIASGGSLHSGFVLADTSSYYYVRTESGSHVLVRVPFESTQGVDLLTASYVEQKTTVLAGAELFTIATVGAQEGLWRVPVAAPSSRTLLLAKADLGSSMYGPSQLVRAGDGWVFVAGTTAYRVFVPSPNR